MTSLLSVILFGFVLGMRHATDPDHVIAVATIGSHQRSIAGGALIGVLWGVGHTLTIVTVGIAIIAFNVVISPRDRPFDGAGRRPDADPPRDPVAPGLDAADH